jgi:hypothetical protein
MIEEKEVLLHWIDVWIEDSYQVSLKLLDYEYEAHAITTVIDGQERFLHKRFTFRNEEALRFKLEYGEDPYQTLGITQAW